MEGVVELVKSGREMNPIEIKHKRKQRWREGTNHKTEHIWGRKGDEAPLRSSLIVYLGSNIRLRVLAGTRKELENR